MKTTVYEDGLVQAEKDKKRGDKDRKRAINIYSLFIYYVAY